MVGSMTRRIALTGLLVVVGTLTQARPAEACSCAQPPPAREEFARSTSVFEARVVSAQSAPPNLKSTLHVLRGWKGISAGSADIVIDQDTMCGYPFQRDKKYLVYASEVAGQLSVSLCSRTAPSEKAAADFPELDRLAKAQPAPSAAPSAPPSSTPPAQTSAHVSTQIAPVGSATPSGSAPAPVSPRGTSCTVSTSSWSARASWLGLLALAGAALIARARRSRA